MIANGDLTFSGTENFHNDPDGAASLRIAATLQDAPADGVTIDWLLAHLFDRSPEFLFLALTPMAVVPATSTLAGALLVVIAGPLVFHHRGIFVPRFLAQRKFSRAEVKRGFKSLTAVLKCYESYAVRHPHPPVRHHTRLVGILASILAVILLIPLPFSNILPGLTIGTVALASLEQDSKLLIMASLLTVVSLLLVFLEAFSAYHLAHALL